MHTLLIYLYTGYFFRTKILFHFLKDCPSTTLHIYKKIVTVKIRCIPQSYVLSLDLLQTSTLFSVEYFDNTLE